MGVPTRTRSKAGLLSSGVKTADVAVKATPGAVYWLTISAIAAGVVGLANSTTDSATYVWKITLPTSGYAHYIFDPPLEFSIGIWLDVASGTVDVIVGYIQMNFIKKVLIKLGAVKAKKILTPHEKAELGQGTWGRQDNPTTGTVIPTIAKPKVSLKMRVYRAKTDTWEEVK